MAISYFAIIMDGFNKPANLDLINKPDSKLFITDGLFSSGFSFIQDLFRSGMRLICQAFSENYLLDGTTLILRLPWSEDYEAQTENKERFLRQSWSENYRYNLTNYRRIPWSENYETDTLRFAKQPFSKDYLIEDK